MLNNMTEAITTTPTTDATMLPTSATPPPTTPSAEEAQGEKGAIKNSTSSSNVTSATTQTKAKTIFSWLKSATKTFESAESKSSKNNRLATDKSPTDNAAEECTCETDEPIAERNDAQTSRAKSPDATLREFRGVQTLRHLWNKRISEESSRHKTLGNSKVNKLTKSISCLVNAANARDSSTCKSDELLERRRTQTKRAQSLHDCTRLGDAEEPEREIDFFHREKDNFYKYKTAEQAGKHLAREANVRSKVKRGSSVAEDVHFPATNATEKGDRIHWLKRQDLVIKRREENCQRDANMAIRDCKGNSVATSPLSGDAVISSVDIRQMEMPPIQAGSQSELSGVSSDTDTLTAANSPQHASRKRVTAGETTSAPSSKRGSSDSSSTASNVTAGRSARRSSSSAARKYSFKTHNRSYHTPRKMNNNKDGGAGGSSGGGGSSNFSMVAKLTQQFNEIIQKDKKLLEEVKRKNGVLMLRGGHVYKVVEKNPSQTSNSSSPTVSRSSSRAKDMSPRTSMVQRNIKRFETRVSTEEDSEKPKVPAKSLQVLRKRHEIVANKSHISLSSPSSKRLSLSLPQQGVGGESKLSVVTEETKTPMDTEEKSIVAAVSGDTTQANVLNTKATESTYNDVADSNCSSQYIGGNNANTVNQAETRASPTNGTEQMQTPLRADNVAEKATTAGERLPPEGQEDGHMKAVSILEQQTNDANSSSEETTITEDSLDDKQQEKEKEEEEAEKGKIPNSSTVESVTTTEVSGDDLDDGVSDEKVKQRKHKYAKIYEKFRFRSPFSGGQSKKSSTTPTTTPTRSPPAEKSSSVDKKAEEATEPTAIETNSEPEAKMLLDALNVIDRKLKGLSSPDAIETPIILCENDDFEQRVLPNSSFVYQTSAKQVSNNQLIVTQAVNVALVNSLEGEQMIMEQKDLQNLQTNYATLVDKREDVEVKQDENEEEAEEEAIYEPIVALKEPKTESKYPQQSFLFKSKAACKASVEDVTETTVALASPVEDIYQTVEEVQLQKLAAAEKAASTLNDYESIAGSCEQTTPASENATKTAYEDGYEICEPPPDEPITQTPSTATIMRRTNDKLPELPKPKRRLPKSPMPGKRPPKPSSLLPSEETTAGGVSSTNAPLELLDDNDDHHYYADDENIYDTIKGASLHCYESLQAGAVKLEKLPRKNSDTVSLTSNCYESITHYRRILTNGVGGHLAAGSSSGSTLTISSDHKTNSLYEVSLAAGLLYGAGSSSSSGSNAGGGGGSGGSSAKNSTGVGSSCGLGGISGGDASRNNYSHSNAASSDNSDGWIDISDAELEGAGHGSGQVAKQQFIVVRERSKVHRSPDWSKRVRDKRLHQKKAMSCIEDDSDHYYESLSPLGNKRHSMQVVQRTNSITHHKRNQDLPRYAVGTSQRSKKYSASAHALGKGDFDDYDSFDTDTDDHYETEENLKNHNDSGVDIRNVKLPDPPSHSTNQVYAIVRKFKNFISNKKSPSSADKHGSQQKIYENSSQFYVNGNIYENSPKAKSKMQKPKKSSKQGTPTASTDDIYENTEFHTPPAINTINAIDVTTTSPTQTLSTSEKTLSLNATNAELISSTLRSKSKSGKSFKSRLRKSLVGSTFDSKQLSTLTPTRSTFYIDDPSHGGSGELDSGFSEKASSGDLPPVEASEPTVDTQRFSTVARKAKKETKSANSQRRRTTIGIRPHEPPPPPPEDTVKAKHQSAAATSWYAECGVFKNVSNNLTLDEQSLSGSKSVISQNGSMTVNGGTSWYAEAGLYQTSGISVASGSSGSSGVSTGNEGGLGDDLSHSMFLNEPLYQIYSAAKLESISRDMEDHDGGSTDGYEEIGHSGRGPNRRSEEECQKRSRPTALQLVGPKNGPSRTLWSEIPEVINSCILPTLTPRERGLQEAKFEIITSEASYLKSLNLLRSHFMNHPLFRDTAVVTPRDRKALFSYIVPVHECSERLLTELESCWQDNIMLLGLSKRIYAIAERYFHVYIAFCEHQGRMDRTLRRLKEAKGTFTQNLDLLEASPICCGLNLHSFLMLPMQRITRLPLLIDAVFSKVSPNDDEYDNWKMTFAIMNKIVTQCNEAANRCEQAYEIERISRQLEFPTSIRALAIAPMGMPVQGSKPRFLVKKGELTHLIWRGDDTKLTFGKKFTKSTIFAFLFSDLLVLTKRKGEQQFLVFDYCPRNMLTISSGDSLPQLPTKDLSQTSKNLILMTLLENHERKTVELVFSCPSVSEQERWLQAMRPPEAETPGEKLYEQWDCPQVIVKHAHEAQEPDLLNLEIGDVVNVTRKLPDGWYQGERIRDGAIGWFPGSYAEEVNSAHVRARNLKQRYRLLTFTASYLESQKRKY